MIGNKRKNEENIFDLIQKYAEDRCTKNEVKEIIRWFENPSHHLKIYQALTKLWYKTESQSKQQVDLKGVLDRIHHKINLYNEDQTGYTQFKWRTVLNAFTKIAAILFLPLLIISAVYFSRDESIFPRESLYSRVHVPMGSKLKTELPDGTTVWLNSGSTLRYPQKFSRKDREVYLSGEAFFDVVSDRLHPLLVRTGELDIKVYGTRFNVMAYPNEEYIATTLETGKVSIEKPDQENKIMRYCFLQTGERAVYHKKEKTVNKYKTDPYKYSSWKDDKLIFRNDPLEVVIKRLRRLYNADIEFAGTSPELGKHPFTLIVEEETLLQVLEYLTVAAPIEFTIIPTRRTKDGQFIKKKYILSERKTN